jgi:hypothetical protein
MFTKNIIDDIPIKFAEMSEILDVPSRLEQLALWEKNAEQEKSRLYKKADKLDIHNNSLAIQDANALTDLMNKVDLEKIKIPVVMPTKVVDGYSTTKGKLDQYYLKMKTEEKLLWLSNISFFITPQLLEIMETLEVQSTRHKLIGGESRMGKTTFFKWLSSQLKREIRETYTYVPFAHLESTTDFLSLKPFHQLLITHLGGHYKTHGTESNEPFLRGQAIALMLCARTKMVVIDEINVWAVATIQRKLIEFSNLAPKWIRIIGTAVDPGKFTDGDSEMLGRFGTPIILAPYIGDRLENLLLFFDLILPFTRSELHLTKYKYKNKESDGMCQLIENMTGGIFGDIVDLLHDAAYTTIKNGGLAISPTQLEVSWRKVSGSRHAK